MPARAREFPRSPSLTNDPRWDRVASLDRIGDALPRRRISFVLPRFLLEAISGIGLFLLIFLGHCSFAHAFQFHLLQYQPDPSFHANEALTKLRATPSWEFLTPDWFELIQLRMKAHTGPTLSLEGKVLDAAGNPVPNALVVLRLAQTPSLPCQCGTMFLPSDGPISMVSMCSMTLLHRGSN